jgi:hypothetical protein
VAAAVAVFVGSGVVAGAPPARAAAGCAVTYSVSSQWQTGFGASVAVTNLGDAISQWTLEWSFTAGQRVTEHWNTVITQSAAAVTARNVSYNGSLATGGRTEFGFNGSWSGSNPSPTVFRLNGTTCTGGVDPGPDPGPGPGPAPGLPNPTNVRHVGVWRRHVGVWRRRVGRVRGAGRRQLRPAPPSPANTPTPEANTATWRANTTT